MSGPLPVEIVRPKHDKATRVGLAAAPFVLLFFRGWIVMLLAPQFGFAIGYWKSIAACLLVSHLFSNGGSSYLRWTRDPK